MCNLDCDLSLRHRCNKGPNVTPAEEANLPSTYRLTTQLTYIMKRRSPGWRREVLNSGWSFLRNIIIFQYLLARRRIISRPTRCEVGRDSSVGIATRYGLDGPARFFASVQTGPGVHPACCKMGTGSLSRELSGRGVALTANPHVAPRLKKQ